MNIFLALQRGPASALFEVNGKTPTNFQWELAQTLIARIFAQFGVGYREMLGVQRTVSHGNRSKDPGYSGK